MKLVKKSWQKFTRTAGFSNHLFFQVTEKIHQGSSFKKCVWRKVMKYYIKNNSLIKVIGKMLDHSGKLVSFLKDFFLTSFKMPVCIILSGIAHAAFSKFPWHKEFLSVLGTRPDGRARVLREQNFSGLASGALFLVHFPWQLLGGCSSSQHPLHSWIKAERAAPMWATAGLTEEIKGRRWNLVKGLRLLLEMARGPHVPLLWLKQIPRPRLMWTGRSGSPQRGHLVIPILWNSLWKPHLRNTALESHSGLGAACLTYDRGRKQNHRAVQNSRANLGFYSQSVVLVVYAFLSIWEKLWTKENGIMIQNFTPLV